MYTSLKIIADENIPQVLEAFGDLGEVELLPGRKITREHLLDCQCLVIRTVTRIDEKLLQETPVEFVGTATIGTDHVDLVYLENNNIAFANAAGCNAEAASEYVIGGLFSLSERKGFGAQGADIAEIAKTVAERRGLVAECQILGDGLPAMDTAQASEIAEHLKFLTGKAASSVAFGTEAPYYNAMQTETIVIGPGSINQAHQPDEFLPIEHIDPTIELLKQLIHRFCIQV